MGNRKTFRLTVLLLFAALLPACGRRVEPTVFRARDYVPAEWTIPGPVTVVLLVRTRDIFTCDEYDYVFRRLLAVHGERVRFRFVNQTMMNHPMHLHGMWSDLEDENGAFKVRKHTIDMPPGTRRSVRVTADALGRWAFHCHLLFHMEAGMFREVRVQE